MNNNYDFFISGVSIRVKKLREELTLVNSKLLYIYKCIDENKDNIPNYDKLLRTLKKYEKTKDHSLLHVIAKLQKPNIVSNYIDSFVLSVKRKKEIIKVGNKQLKLKKVKSRIYYEIIRSFNSRISEHLLTGYSFNMGNGLSSLYIKNVKRNFTTGKYGRLKVDYNESKKILLNIIKEVDIDLYNRYASKDISYRTFIKLSKKYTYSPIENKDKPKWIVYYTDTRVSYFIWKKVFAKVKNRSLFWFVPTKFINTKDRLRTTLFKTFKSERDIIINKDIGLVDKLYMLLRYNKNYYLKFEQ